MFFFYSYVLRLVYFPIFENLFPLSKDQCDYFNGNQWENLPSVTMTIDMVQLTNKNQVNWSEKSQLCHAQLSINKKQIKKKCHAASDLPVQFCISHNIFPIQQAEITQIHKHSKFTITFNSCKTEIIYRYRMHIC